jgi:hypothetical protein
MFGVHGEHLRLGCWLFHWICGCCVEVCGWLWVEYLWYVCDLNDCLSGGGDLLSSCLG